MRRFLGFCLLLLSLPVFAQETPDALVRRVTDEVLEIVRKDKEIQNGNARKVVDLVEAKVLPNFNFPHMTALAVGKEWRRATPQQQERLTQEFKTLLVRTYSNSLTAYRNETIKFKPFTLPAGATDALVRTEVHQAGNKPIQLDYNLEKLDSGWKVYDVVVAGISLVTNYRDQFGQEIRNGGIDGLTQSLAAKNQALDAATAEKK